MLSKQERHFLEGTVLQVNVSRGGIPKLPVQGRVWVGERGLEGDACRNMKVHGGPLQAVLLIAVEQLAEIRECGYAVAPGVLGENLTVQGLNFTALQPGMRLRAGDALLRVTKLRKPCATLDGLGRGIQKAVLGRGGYYASVVEPGGVAAGDSVRVEF
jgi:MOSC domain-containing protein YiiM